MRAPTRSTEAELRAAWFAAMRRGDLSDAWRIADDVLNTRQDERRPSGRPRHEQWVWDGRPLAGQHVLVRCYHGLGDTIMFARCLPRLDEIAGQTTVWVQPALIPLLETLPGHRRLLPLHHGPPAVDYDVDVEIMELGHALRLTLDSLGETVPYFDVPGAARLSSTYSVGIAATTGQWDERRSLPLEALEPLLAVPGLEWCNLQLQPPLPGMRDLSTPDVVLLAQRLRALDLVITPDTMLAHLAGALAVPTWTLLPYDSDWRWMQPERRASPWYPTMRLFRQSRPGAWQPVIAAVIDALTGRVG